MAATTAAMIQAVYRKLFNAGTVPMPMAKQMEQITAAGCQMLCCRVIMPITNKTAATPLNSKHTRSIFFIVEGLQYALWQFPGLRGWGFFYLLHRACQQLLPWKPGPVRSRELQMI